MAKRIFTKSFNHISWISAKKFFTLHGEISHPNCYWMFWILISLILYNKNKWKCAKHVEMHTSNPWLYRAERMRYVLCHGRRSIIYPLWLNLTYKLLLKVLNFNILDFEQQKQMKMCKACKNAYTHTHTHTHTHIHPHTHTHFQI